MGIGLFGCSATSALINHSSLDVNSKMSNTIFLDPLTTNKQTVLIQVKNTTSENLKGIVTTLTNDFNNAGWKVVNNPDMAYNMVQINVLQAGEAKDPDAVWNAIQSGYGSAALGGLAGLASFYSGGNVASSLGIGLGAGAVSWVTDQLVKNVAYSLITDVQISVKTPNSVASNHKANLQQGTSTVEFQDYKNSGNWLKYQTRVGTVAQKVNLKFADAKPVIVDQLSQQIAGIFISNNE